MIRIEDKYAITADEHCFSVSKISVASDKAKEPGKEYFTALSWHTTLAEAIKSVFNRILRDEVGSDTIRTLAETMELVRSIDSRFHDSLYEHAGQW